MKKIRFEIIIFTVEFVYMLLELVASRVLSPYFGNSNLVWTVVIGIILLSSSIGNFLGGKIADKENKERNLKIILLCICASILFTAIIQRNSVEILSVLIKSNTIGSIITTILLFFIPSLCMGFISPIVLKLKLENIDIAGRTAGRLNAIATIGGITGTFIGGFLLIPNIVSSYILYMLVIILALLVPIVDLKFKSWTNIVVSVLLITSIILLSINISTNEKNSQKVLNGDTNCIVSYDTEYGHVNIYNKHEGFEQIRILQIDDGYESATFTDPNRKYELVYDYTKYYNLIFNSGIEINTTLMIGGAGYSYPKYFISNHLDKSMDVVEIDQQITNIAKQYFYLDTLIKDYDLKNSKRLNLITEDGRVFLNKNQKKYDAILNDAFSGNIPPATLTTIEAIKHIKYSLTTGGLYMSNIISSLEGNNSKFLRAEVNTLNKIFKNVYVIPCKSNNKLESTQNIMVIATDTDIQFDNPYNLQIKSNEIILTDDYCPVEQLCPLKK